ncbi:glycosyltransferase family 39 protein [Candidatus Gottesmanbacteria bacterium]|nr:glycosyltransferase family 39 protein [Candidatus Gottesmanbacteria bacterium]
MKKTELFVLAIVTLVAVTTRLYGLGNPVADWHSWRQVDTATVARNFLKFGIDPLRPRFDDLSNIPSGKDNPKGYRMVEFPIYQVTAALGARLFPGISIEILLRTLTIVASVGSGILIGLIVASVLDAYTGIIASLLYAVLPYSMYYGRTTLPDPHMVFWALLSIYLLVKAQSAKGEKIWLLLATAAICGAIALLIKPPALFLLLPAVYIIFRRFSFSKNLFIGLFVYWFICLCPLWWWRSWIMQYPEGIPVYTWLLNEGNIRFKGAWFYWLFAERLGKLILGYWGLVPLGLGLLVKPEKNEGWFFRWWLISAIAYMVIIARGNVQHDYYQILIIPVVSVYLAKGFFFLLTNSVFSKLTAYPLSLITLLFMLAFSWYTIRTYYWINRQEIVDVGRYADALLPKNAKVIAPYNGDTTFLYQTDRQGWPIGFDIDKKITLGATHYVTLSPTDKDLETRDLAQIYTVLVRNDKFAIIDLTKKRE